MLNTIMLLYSINVTEAKNYDECESDTDSEAPVVDLT